MSTSCPSAKSDDALAVPVADALIFKNSFATPHCILTKSVKNKKNKFIYDLNIGNIKKNNFNKIDDLLIFLKRKNFKLLNLN